MTASVLLGLVAFVVVAVIVLTRLATRTELGTWDRKWWRQHAALEEMTSNDPAVSAGHVRVLSGEVPPLAVPNREETRDTPDPQEHRRAA